MAFKLGTQFETWLDRKIEVLKAEGILRSKFNDLKKSWSVVSDDHSSQPTPTEAHRKNNRHFDPNTPNMNYFPEYKDDPTKGSEHAYTDQPEIAEDGGVNQSGAQLGSHGSPHDISPQSDYYKFVWQDDEDFEAVLGPPGGSYHDYTDEILREIDSELSDLHTDLNTQNPEGQGPGRRPRSESKWSQRSRSGDEGHVELIGNRKEEVGSARFVTPPGDNDDTDEDSFKVSSVYLFFLRFSPFHSCCFYYSLLHI